MKHWARTATFKCLEVLPDSLGDTVYHLLQRNFGRVSIEQAFELQLQRYRTMTAALRGLGFSPKGRAVLEIGSGWFPILPFLILFEGQACEVSTYDINEHYSHDAVSKLKGLFSARVAPIPDEEDLNDKLGLPSTVRYFPNTDLAQNPPPPESIDLVLSTCVLEHMQPDKILEVHEKARDFLRRGALIYHLISPSDHRAHTDSSLSLYDFLRFSQDEWDRIQTRFDYHNRLRLPQYRSLFEAAGLKILFEKHSWPGAHHDLVQDLEAMNLHEDFRGFSTEDLTAGALEFVLSR